MIRAITCLETAARRLKRFVNTPDNHGNGSDEKSKEEKWASKM